MSTPPHWLKSQNITHKLWKGHPIWNRVNLVFSDTCIIYLAITSLSLVLLILIWIEFDFTDMIAHLSYNALKEPANLMSDVKDNTHENLIWLEFSCWICWIINKLMWWSVVVRCIPLFWFAVTTKKNPIISFAYL